MDARQAVTVLCYVLCAGLVVGQADVFQHTPGDIDAFEGQDVDFLWTLSTNMASGATVVFKDEQLKDYFAISFKRLIRKAMYNPRMSMIGDLERSFGFRLSRVSLTDSGGYLCKYGGRTYRGASLVVRETTTTTTTTDRETTESSTIRTYTAKTSTYSNETGKVDLVTTQPSMLTTYLPRAAADTEASWEPLTTERVQSSKPLTMDSRYSPGTFAYQVHEQRGNKQVGDTGPQDISGVDANKAMLEGNNPDDFKMQLMIIGTAAAAGFVLLCVIVLIIGCKLMKNTRNLGTLPRVAVDPNSEMASLTLPRTARACGSEYLGPDAFTRDSDQPDQGACRMSAMSTEGIYAEIPDNKVLIVNDTYLTMSGATPARPSPPHIENNAYYNCQDSQAASQPEVEMSTQEDGATYTLPSQSMSVQDAGQPRDPPGGEIKPTCPDIYLHMPESKFSSLSSTK